MNETINKICPCCGQASVGEHDICEVCGWQNDPIQADHPDFAGGANQMSLNEARSAFRIGLDVK